MNHWFGPPWPSEELRAPVCADDEERIPIPVGAACMWCGELIDEDARGQDITVFGENGPKPGYVHIECIFRKSMGGPAHILGTCICCGGTDLPDMGMTPREAALWTWDHFTGAQTFYEYDDPPEEGYVP